MGRMKADGGTSLSEFWQGLWSARREPPLALQIPTTRVDTGATLGGVLRPRQSYFQLRVNQLFLAATRKWFTSIEPMVVALSEFSFGGNMSTVPYVVGPGKLKGLATAEPKGMLYRDTKVAGLHPYAGGTVSLAIVLCQVPIDNVANRFLRVLESTSQAFDFSTMLTPYLKIGRVILDGVTELLGLAETKPLLGWRQEFDDGGLPLAPGFFALVDAPDVDPATLWVKDRQLYVGASSRDSRPFRDADFVLFSVTQPSDGNRGDLSQLPFYELWKRVQQDAVVVTEDGKKSLQANLTALAQAVLLSPDLTEPQANALVAEYYDKAIALREGARGRPVALSPRLRFAELKPCSTSIAPSRSSTTRQSSTKKTGPAERANLTEPSEMSRSAS
jgi:hypothetical protein